MKLKTLLLGVATVVVTANSAMADHTWSWNTKERFAYDRDATDKFRANELTFDLFGNYNKGQRKWNDVFDTSMRHGDFGGGLGVNYFFTPILGIGGDAYWLDDKGSFINNVSSSLIVRFPIDCVAPYMFGGVGRNFDPVDEWAAHAGVGVEFRLNPFTGIFLDGRYVFADKSSDYSMLRTGLRFAF